MKATQNNKSPMKNTHQNKSGVNVSTIAQAVALSLLAASTAHAVDATWSGMSNNLWQTTANWSAAPFPGTTTSLTSYANTDTATFSNAGSGAIDLGGAVNIKNILFSAGAGSFAIGGATDALYLTGAGSITVNGGVTANQTIGATGGTINLSSASSSTYSFLNNGTGTLTIADAVTANQIATKASTLTLGGAGNGVVSGALTYAAGSGAGASGLALTKIGSGTWTLSGANTYSGITTINGGQLVYDFSTGNTPVSSANTIKLSNAGVTFKGNSTGATTVATGTLDLGGNYDVVNKVTLDANGGSGVALTVANLNYSVGTGAVSILLDLSSSAANSMTLSALGTSYSVQNGVLMAGNTGNFRSNTIVHDSTGYGFATLSGATSGSIGRLTSSSAAATTLTASNSSNTANYFLTTSGTLTRTAGLDYSTLTIDSTAGAVTLDTGANSIAASGQGKGILVTGNNDVTLAGSASFGSTGLVYNYSSGKLTINQSTASTTAFVLGGTGFIDYAGTVGGSIGTGFAIETLVRISKAQDLTVGTSTSKFRVSSGVLEIGADLNGVTAGDFTNSLGTGAHQIVFRGDSGLSASGANRTVNFGGASAGISWGASGFLTNADDSTDGGYTLKLSSAQSDSTVEVQNGIALGTNTNRVIEVANGSASTDAVLSGVLSGAGATLTKTGLGTLSLTAANTYTGATVVNAGTLSVNNTLASSSVMVASGATLKLNGSISGTASVSGTLGGNGTISGATTIQGTLAAGNSIGTLNTGNLTLASTSVLDVELGRNGTTPTSDLTNVTGTVAIDSGADLKLTLSTGFNLLEGDIIFLIDNDNTDAIQGVFTSLNGVNTTLGEGSKFTWNSQSWEITYKADSATSSFSGGNDVALMVVPEPSTWVMLLGGIGMLAFGQRLRRRGVE